MSADTAAARSLGEQVAEVFGAQQDGWPVSAVQIGDDRRRRCPQSGIETETGQCIHGLCLRLRQIESEFGVTVDRPFVWTPAVRLACAHEQHT